MGILERIKEIEQEMDKTQKNKATEGHLGMLKARLAKLRSELLTPSSGGGGGQVIRRAALSYAFLSGPRCIFYGAPPEVVGVVRVCAVVVSEAEHSSSSATVCAHQQACGRWAMHAGFVLRERHVVLRAGASPSLFMCM